MPVFKFRLFECVGKRNQKERGRKLSCLVVISTP